MATQRSIAGIVWERWIVGVNKRGSFIYKYGPFKCFLTAGAAVAAVWLQSEGTRSSSERSGLKPTLKTIPDQQVDLCTGPTSNALVCILSRLYLRFWPAPVCKCGKKKCWMLANTCLPACVRVHLQAHTLEREKAPLTAPVPSTPLWFLMRSH